MRKSQKDYFYANCCLFNDNFRRHNLVAKIFINNDLSLFSIYCPEILSQITEKNSLTVPEKSINRRANERTERTDGKMEMNPETFLGKAGVQQVQKQNKSTDGLTQTL